MSTDKDREYWLQRMAALIEEAGRTFAGVPEKKENIPGGLSWTQPKKKPCRDCLQHQIWDCIGHMYETDSLKVFAVAAIMAIMAGRDVGAEDAHALMVNDIKLGLGKRDYKDLYERMQKWEEVAE